MPYRTRPPLRTYPLRSSRVMLVVAIVLAFLSVASVPVAVAGWGHLDFTVLLILLSPWLLTLGYALSVKHDVVAGGAGAIQLYEREVVVPQPFVGAPLAFPIDAVSLEVQRFEGRLLFQTISVIEVLHLRFESMNRGVSTRLFERPEQLRDLMADIEALKRDEPLPSHEARPPPAEEDPDDDGYGAQLEAELDAFD